MFVHAKKRSRIGFNTGTKIYIGTIGSLCGNEAICMECKTVPQTIAAIFSIQYNTETLETLETERSSSETLKEREREGGGR